MGPTLTMLTAGLLAAQTTAPTCNCQKNAATSGYVQPVPAGLAQTSASTPSSGFGLFRSNKNDTTMVAANEDRPILSRLQSLFGMKKDQVDATTYTAEPPMVQTTKPAPARQMQRLPAGQPNNAEPAPFPSVPVSAAPGKAVQPVTFQAVPVDQAAPAATIPASAGSKVMPPSRPNRISQELVSKVGHETDYSWITGQLRIENGLYVIHYATPEVVDQYQGHLVLNSDRDLRGFQDGDFVSVRGSVSGGVGSRPMYRVTNIDRLPR